MVYFCFSVIVGVKKYNFKNVLGDLYNDNCGISWWYKIFYRENCFMFVLLLIK